ncbi:hypothetical protein [Streptomyces sp. NPDC048361]|uniref:SCO2400 family protein n=1 Tax=Streptomyces sp. NPDC048361 TaxID=3154720 RepID=UPI003424A153
MDYCHSCRRHLNGALACAGCGTPAQELAPAPEDELLVYAGAPSHGGAEVLAPSGHRRARKGRRARRKRGKVVLFGSAGLVLVAGAVGFVQMAMEPSVNDRASSVHEDETISDPQPLPSGAAVTAPSRPTAEPVSSRRRGSGAGTASPGADGDGPRHAGSSPKVTASGPADPRPPSSRPSSSASPGASDSPGTGEPPPSSQPPSTPAPPPPPPPTPSPSPSQTCHRFLWWCT